MTTFALVDATLVRPHPDRMGVDVMPGATLVVEGGRIASLDGPVPAGAERIDVAGRLVTPGLVDAHTHAMFLGDRALEFCRRAAGVSYLELAKAGGGIVATVRPTREGPSTERLARTKKRLRRLLANGVTTVEVKSGYGLSTSSERTMLEELAAIDDADLPRVLPTLMAAHAIPPEVGGDATARADWVRRIVDELIPEVAARRLAGRVDVFVEQSAYSPSEARLIAAAARAHGLALHLHVDQLTAGKGAELAAELGAQAVAHLERTSPEGVAALASSGTVAVLLPTATLAAREPGYAPARRLVEAGVPIALATNLNPGTAPTESTALTFFLAAVGLGLTPEELLWAATRGGAKALGLDDCGLISPGFPADLVLWNAREPAHLAYHAGVNHIRSVWREGRLVAERPWADAECDGVL
jgi:imidazolonepropionase